MTTKSISQQVNNICEPTCRWDPTFRPRLSLTWVAALPVNSCTECSLQCTSCALHLRADPSYSVIGNTANIPRQWTLPTAAPQPAWKAIIAHHHCPEPALKAILASLPKTSLKGNIAIIAQHHCTEPSLKAILASFWAHNCSGQLRWDWHLWWW